MVAALSLHSILLLSLLAWSFTAFCNKPALAIKLPDDIVQQEVFKSGDGGYDCFRIPALLITPKSTLLAFAEGRGQHTNVCSDHGDVHIVLKRSTNFGVTWSNLTVVYSEYPDHTIGNPAPVVDWETGKIILAFCQDNKKVFTLQSSDDGLTWGGMMDITAVANGGNWGFVGTGPPGGIQLPSRRLIIGTYASGGGPGSYAIFSDDGGKTWQRSQPTNNPNTGECQLASLGQMGSPMLVLAMRSELGRYIAYSNDSGETWFNTTLAKSLSPQTPCESSLLSIPYKGAYMDTHLYLTSPHSVSRNNMTLFTSSDGGHSWKEGFVIWEGPSGYSSMAYHELRVYCLYERGNTSYQETLTLASFSPLIL